MRRERPRPTNAERQKGFEMKASVKIMRSYDYNHFEICLSSDEEMSLEQVDDLRKEAARLVDKAVEQYKVAKCHLNFVQNNSYDLGELRKEVKIITENFPKSEWTEEQKAKVKKLEDINYWKSRDYDYEDDWDVNY